MRVLTISYIVRSTYKLFTKTELTKCILKIIYYNNVYWKLKLINYLLKWNEQSVFCMNYQK